MSLRSLRPVLIQAENELPEVETLVILAGLANYWRTKSVPFRRRHPRRGGDQVRGHHREDLRYGRRDHPHVLTLHPALRHPSFFIWSRGRGWYVDSSVGAAPLNLEKLFFGCIGADSLAKSFGSACSPRSTTLKRVSFRRSHVLEKMG